MISSAGYSFAPPYIQSTGILHTALDNSYHLIYSRRPLFSVSNMSSMSLNSSNVFSSKNLCEVMLSSLPKAASPHLRDPYDAVALLSHACMLAVGFRLEGLGEDHRIGSSVLYLYSLPFPSTASNIVSHRASIRPEFPSTSSFFLE